MNIRELREKIGENQARLREILAGAEAENRDLNDAERVEWDSLKADSGALAERVRRAEALDAEERELAMGSGRNPESRKGPAILKFGLGDSEERSFLHYIRTGDPAGLEYRAYNDTEMNVGTDADGGYAVPTGLYNQIIAKRGEAMLRDKLGCLPIPGKGTTVSAPVDNEADVLFTSVAELGAIGRDAPALAGKDLTLVKYGKHVDPSWELLRDEDAALMNWLSGWVARGMAATHNNLLITEALANGTAALTLDSATAIGETEIAELVGKLAPEYQDGAQWILKGTTLASIQTVGGTNVFKFAPPAETLAGKPTLWNFPVNQSSFMPAMTAGLKSLLFGNFAFMGYREGTGLTMLRDPYTAAGTGQVKLWFWFDAVYGVLLAEAIAYATQAAA